MQSDRTRTLIRWALWVTLILIAVIAWNVAAILFPAGGLPTLIIVLPVFWTVHRLGFVIARRV